MTLDLDKISQDIKANRNEVIEKLVRFSTTDLMFFWGQEKDLIIKQKEVWQPILDWAENELNAKNEISHNINAPRSCATSETRMSVFLKGLSDKELAAFYITAINTKSILLAAAMVRKQITAEKAMQAAFLEEDFQASIWGEVDDYAKRKKEIAEELKQVEEFLE